MCGAIFGKLTNSGVTPASGGPTQFYPDPNQAVQALASASPRTAQPGTSSVDGTINPDGSENEQVVNSPPPDLPQPKLVQPSFAEASSSAPGAPLANKELTTKGKLLELALEGGLGAAAGASASLPINNGHTRVGLGPSVLAGAHVPMGLQEDANTLQQQQLAQQRERAEIAAIPGRQQIENNLKTAQTEWYNNRGESVGLHDLKAGDTLVDRNGNTVGTGADLQSAAKAKAVGKTQGTAEAAASLGASPTQILSSIGIKNPTPRNVTTAQAYLDANAGDAAAAIRQMNADRVANAQKIAQTRANLAAGTTGLTPAQQRQLNADPDFAAARTEATGIARNLSKLESDQFALPGDVETARTNAAAAAQRMNAAKARVLGGNGKPTVTPSSTGGTVRMTGPKGTFDVPASKVGVFQQNGYRQIGQ